MRLALISPQGNYFNNSDLDQIWKNGLGARYIIWSGLSSALLIVAALTPSNYKIDIIDENIEPVDFEKKYDLVGISFMTQQATRAYQIASKYKEKGIPVVMGGIHATTLPEEATKYADSVIVGEAEYLWPVFIKDFENNSIKKIYSMNKTVHLDDSPIPRYDLIKNKKYQVIWIQTTRGCPHDCDFCAASKIYGKKYRQKSIDRIIQEINYIKHLFGENVLIGFSDDNFLINKRFSLELLNKLKPLKIKWVAQTDISIAEKKEVLELLKESGCLHFYIGLESLEDKNLRNLDKDSWKYSQLKNYSKNIFTIQSYGIGVMGSFIVGLENDDETVFKRIENFILENNLLEAQIIILTPLPGTRLRKKLEMENRLLDTNWDNYTYFKVNFIHNTLSKEQLEKGVIDLYKKINSQEFYFKKFEHFKNIFKKINKKTKS